MHSLLVAWKATPKPVHIVATVKDNEWEAV